LRYGHRSTLLAGILAAILAGGACSRSPTPTPAHTALPPLSGSGGGRIAFASNRDGNYEIYAMNADGSEARRLTHNPFQDREPSWSPDGTLLLFQSTRSRHTDLYVINADGTDERQLTTAGAASGDWSPDGQRIAYVSGEPSMDLYLMGADGTNPARLTDLGEDWAISTPDWSPDGTHIACTLDAWPRGGSEADFSVWVLSLADWTGEPLGLDRLRPLPRTGMGLNDQPAWSPDGARLAYGAAEGNQPAVYLIDADGTNPRRVPGQALVEDSRPTWSPDGTRLVVQCDAGKGWDICTLNLDGTDRRRLTSDKWNDVEPAWSR